MNYLKYVLISSFNLAIKLVIFLPCDRWFPMELLMSDIEKISQKSREFKQREEEILNCAMELFLEHGEEKVTVEGQKLAKWIFESETEF